MRRAALALCFVGALTALLGAQAAARVQNRTLLVPDVGAITYGIAVPGGAAASETKPLIVALHPGGERIPNYGSLFMQQVVAPAFAGLDAVIVSPDCPGRSWTDANAERAVLALVERVRGELAIDPRRVLVTGFSMGGRGAWFMASRHADLFTAAVIVAASKGDEPVERLATVPTYVIHSRRDQVVPFAPAEQLARQLEELGRPIHFEALGDLGHYEMGRYVEPMRRAARWIAERWDK
jgi:predicted peptidase